MKETRRKVSAAKHADLEGQITQPQNCRFLTGQRVTLAIVTAAGLALATGCSSTKHTSACYSPPPATAYAPPPEPAPKAAETVEGNVVVPLQQETVKVGKREVDAGSVRLKKIVKTETINQPVELRREEIVIDRTSGPGETANAQLSTAFTEGEITIPLKREEVVMEKQTVSAGNITVRTRAHTEQQFVQTQVRREDIDLASLNQPGVTVSENVKAGTPIYGAASTPGGTSAGAATSDSGIITEPGKLTSQNAAKFNGWGVKFSNVKVHKTYGERVFEATSDDGRQLYFVMSEPPSPTIQDGDSVNVTGKFKQRGGTVTLSGLESQGSTMLNQQPYYIEVEKIETAK